MTEFFSKFTCKLFNTHLELRVRMFNVLALTSTISLIAGCIFNRFTDTGNALFFIYASIAVISMLIIWYLNTGGNFLYACLMTNCTFFVGITAMFFFADGYNGGTPMYFLFAVLFMTCVYRDKLAIYSTIFQIIFYGSLLVTAYYFPETVRHIEFEKNRMAHILAYFIVAASAICIAIIYIFRLYDRQNKELIEANKKAEAYTKLKQDLVAELSHELRTPLTVLSGYTQYIVEQIRQDGVNEETFSDLNTVSEEAKRLAELADGTLDLLKTVRDEADKEDNEKRAMINVGTLAKKVAAIQKPLTQKIGVDLQTNIENDLPQIYGNADELTQLIWNVLQNAIIHSCGDRVKIDVKKCGNGAVTLQITDNGCGIPPDIANKIFERGVSGVEGRSGLGLHISREIAKNHGGDIAVVSQPNEGTCVIITIRNLTIDNDLRCVDGGGV